MSIISYRTKHDFLIIGAQKCGTTSLSYFLSQHPDIAFAKVKEVHYFDLNYIKGIDWYKSFFPPKILFRKKLTGEASPYYIFHPLVPERVARIMPGVKLIVLLRNPVDRAYSQYLHELNRGTETMTSFDEAIENEMKQIANEERKLISGELEINPLHQNNSYLSRGYYYEQVLRWNRYFQLSQMHFVKSEDFFLNPESELEGIYRFLNIRNKLPTDLSPQNRNPHAPFSLECKVRLNHVFAGDSKKLAGLIGEKFTWETSPSNQFD